ncbi:LTA synthase family protein [Methylophaga pinxianii]|uniref:LTA synthase family protein n=1 Tax=Methylophaga pinxianii TaxID=2881052 RepID=UPI001CF5A79B|nr:LTA synthase family protein [Methylophaga pinxianii]MCB2425983.1 LTA synthase family protein [Methylophaga pinxianii]UPH47189.1 LTA synthase family protein [Methylophaga pinxianii]
MNRNWPMLGPYQLFLKVMLIGLAILSLSRMGLVVWQWERVSAVTDIWTMFSQGIRADLIIIALLMSPIVLLAPILINRWVWDYTKWILLIWTVLILTILIFMEVSTPAFIMQYDLRPNRLFVEYLKYPREVSAMLWNGFRTEVILGTMFTMFSTWGLICFLKPKFCDYQLEWPEWKVWLMWPLMIIILVLMIRSSFGHRPANPALFARTSDALVNSMFINSTWSVYFAIYSMKDEEKSSELYGKLSNKDILTTLNKLYPWVPTDEHAKNPTMHFQSASRQREKPLNLVIILEESMGASYVESLGGLPVTPNLDKLKDEGWWFEKLYATGTRSVRGIEAVVSGYLPTPARSVVKLTLSQQNFFTLGGLLKEQGYFTEFIYGGESHFDNMASFFIGNGFESVIDQRDYFNPAFLGSWGVSDEDLFNKTHERISEMNKHNQPFLSFVFTSSNHTPYEYPEDRITPYEEPKQTDNNTVKYADYALGQFIERAKKSDYWENTLFLVVADHTNRVYGDDLVPISGFHIPALILGADIEARKIQTVSSQIDLAPTLLSLMGISAHHPMIGRDLTIESEQNAPGRAIMQFADYFALMKDNEVTILRVDQPAVSGEYDLKKRRMNIIGNADQSAQREALAHVLLPSWLYRERRYSISD